MVHLVPHLSWFGLPDVYKKRLSVRSCSKSIRGLPLASMYLCIYVYMYLKTAPLRSSLGTSDGSFRPVIERMRSPTCIVLNVPATNSLNAQATPSKRIPYVSMYLCMYFYSFSSSLKHLICQVPLFVIAASVRFVTVLS